MSMTQGCFMTFTQGHITKVKVTVHTYQNSLSAPQLLTVILDLDNIEHIIDVNDPRVCHDFDARSYCYLQGQG